MTLAEARRYAVKNRTRIEFTAEGYRCAIDEHGVARIENLRSAPAFTVTEGFDRAEGFELVRGDKRQAVTREALAQMAGPVTVAHHGEDDE